MMKKKMIIQALFAMMLGFAVPAVHAAEGELTAEQKMQALAVEDINAMDAGALANYRGRVEAIANGTEGRQACLDQITAREQLLAMQALAEVDIENMAVDAIDAYAGQVNAIEEGTPGKAARVEAIALRRQVLAAAAREEEIRLIFAKGNDEVIADLKTLFGDDSKPQALYKAALDAKLNEDTDKAKAIKAALLALPEYNTWAGIKPGMSKVKVTLGVAAVVALGYEVIGRIIPKVSQLKRRQKHDENLQGKNMFVEALREEYKAAQRGLKRGYEGLKGFFADEDEDDQEEEAVEQA